MLFAVYGLLTALIIHEKLAVQFSGFMQKAQKSYAQFHLRHI